MPKKPLSLEELIAAERWLDAEGQARRELAADPNNHWLLTQLAVTLYEQKGYAGALDVLRQSFDVLPSCPLTLWNLAGTLDALGHTSQAVQVYGQLIREAAAPGDDPCWESAEWAASLQADSCYRLGRCHLKAGAVAAAGACFRRYLAAVAHGVAGSYSAEEVGRDWATAELSKGRATGADSPKAVVRSMSRQRGGVLPSRVAPGAIRRTLAKVAAGA